MELPIEPRRRIKIPFHRNDYSRYFLEKLASEELDHGSAELVKYEDFYSLNLTIKKEVDLSYEPRTFIGIDL